MVAFFQKKQENYWLYGLGAGIIEAVYCFFIAVLLILLQGIFVGPGNALTILLMLIIMVFSVAVSGFLIFSYPLYLALKKQYLEAIFTILISIVTLVLIGLVVIILKLII